MNLEKTDVLVVGGSLVGLSAALFLAARGVRPIVVERHAGSSPHPRAIGYTRRTMELFRGAGLGDAIPQAPRDHRVRRVRVRSLAGEWFEESSWSSSDRAPSEERRPCSPVNAAGIAQDRLEPMLRARAIELGADVRTRTELVSFAQDAEGVTAVLRGHDGAETTVRAAYLVAADGARSTIRDTLGIGRTGRGWLRTARSVLFRAPLDEHLRKGIVQFSIDQPDFQAFLASYGDGRWVLIFSDDVERDEPALRTMITRAIGRDDVPVEIVATGRWEICALIADRFSAGRVFLAGDAAHALPPNRGGFGANTGIEDAHNLAWKLASVIDGASSHALLDTYDAERRPIAWLRHQQIFARDDFKAFADEAARMAPIYGDDAMELGQLYRSAAVLGAGPDLPPARHPDEWRGQPGTRAPHAWLERDGARLSTLDLFGRGWVLATGEGEEVEHWSAAAAAARDALGIDVAVEVLPPDVRASFGLDEGGASLVRPDGFVAWRAPTPPSDAPTALREALAQVAFATRR